MRKLFTLIVLIYSVIFARVIEFSFSLDTSCFVFKEYEEYIYIEDTTGRSFYISSPGLPALPYRQIYVYLYDQEVIDSTCLTFFRFDTLEEEFVFLPAQPGFFDTVPPFVPPDSLIYSSDTLFPGILILGDTGRMGGYKIGSISLFPFLYIPGERKVVVLREGIIKIYTSYTEGNTVRKDPDFTNIVKEMVINPEDVPMGEPWEPDPEDPEYIIITSPELKMAFLRLAWWRKEKGISTQIITTDQIYSHFNGSDNPEKIRNFIKYYYYNHGTKYFLIGGDTFHVPVRIAERTYKCWGGDTTDHPPTDWYYACLDGTWDGDGDGKYGEEGEIDKWAEVYVTRAPVHDYEEAIRFVEKIIEYETSPPSNYIHKIFLMGFDLDPDEGWYDVIHNKGEDHKKDIKEKYILSYYNVNTEYDSENGTHKKDCLNALNEGYHLVNHIDHGNITIIGVGARNHHQYITTDDIINGIHNGSRQSIFYTISCRSGNFAYYSQTLGRCWGTCFINCREGGGIAFIGNTAQGLFGVLTHHNSWSPAFDKEFFKLLTGRNSTTTLGNVFTEHKNAFANVGNPFTNGGYEWLECTINALGDPLLFIWKGRYEPEDFEVLHPTYLTKEGELYYFEVKVTLNGVPFKDATVTLIKKAYERPEIEIYKWAYTNENGKAGFYIIPLTPGNIYITVSFCKNGIPMPSRYGKPYKGVCIVRIPDYYFSFEEQDIPPYQYTPWNSLSQPICGVRDITAKVVKEPDEGISTPYGEYMYKFKGYDESSDCGSCNMKSFKVLSFGVINLT